MTDQIAKINETLDDFENVGWLTRFFDEAFADCPFELKLVRKETHRSEEWSDFKESVLNKFCAVIFKFRDGTDYLTRYKGVVEEKDGSLTFREPIFMGLRKPNIKEVKPLE